MSLLPSAEAEDLRGHLRKFLATNAGLDRMRALISSQSPGSTVRPGGRAAQEIGLTGLLRAPPRPAGAVPIC